MARVFVFPLALLKEQGKCSEFLTKFNEATKKNYLEFSYTTAHLVYVETDKIKKSCTTYGLNGSNSLISSWNNFASSMSELKGKDDTYPKFDDRKIDFNDKKPIIQRAEINNFGNIYEYYQSIEKLILFITEIDSSLENCYLILTEKDLINGVEYNFPHEIDFKDIPGLFNNNEHTTNKKQFIITGAPGTGKTYHIRKSFMGKSRKRRIPQYIEKSYLRAIISHSKEFKQEEKVVFDDFNFSTYYNFLTYNKELDIAEFIQFHSSYDYTDFIEGLRPVVIGYDEQDKPITQFVRIDGTFKAFCRKAQKYENEKIKFTFIIDEINRADLSRVFGEIMFCLEETYRGKKNRIKTQYQNLPTYYKSTDEKNRVVFKPYTPGYDEFADGFYIPENVYIIGTMNDIDRSVETFDFALRRRFEWIEVSAASTMYTALQEHFMETLCEKYEEDKLKMLCKRATLLNHEIQEAKTYHLNKQFQLGQSYFRHFDLDQVDVNEYLESFFDSDLKQILFEYVRGQQKEEEFINNCRDAFAIASNELVEKYNEIPEYERPYKMETDNSENDG